MFTTKTWASLQPSTFAQPVAFYNGTAVAEPTVARCICGDTINRTVRGEWVHNGNEVYCFPNGYAPR